MNFKERATKSVIDEYESARIIRFALEECEETLEEKMRWHFFVDIMLYFQEGAKGLEEEDFELLLKKEDFIIEELYKMYLESEYQGDTRDDDEVFDFIKNYCIKYFLAVD